MHANGIFSTAFFLFCVLFTTPAMAAKLELPESIWIPGEVQDARRIITKAVEPIPNWRIEDEREGAILATYNSRKHVAKVWIIYDQESISFKYGGSRNLDCSPMGSSCKTIHRAYNRWVKALGAGIAVEIEAANYGAPIDIDRKASNPDGQSLRKKPGLCFAVNGRGLILTNYHQVQGASDIPIAMSDGKLARAQIVAFSKALDLAILDARTSTPNYLTLATTARVDQSVYMPVVAEQSTYTEATIKSTRGGNGDESWLEIETPFRLPVSGGPIIDTRGRVVGIINTELEMVGNLSPDNRGNTNTNWAIKSKYAQLLFAAPVSASVNNTGAKLMRESLCKLNTTGDTPSN